MHARHRYDTSTRRGVAESVTTFVSAVGSGCIYKSSGIIGNYILIHNCDIFTLMYDNISCGILAPGIS